MVAARLWASVGVQECATESCNALVHNVLYEGKSRFMNSRVVMCCRVKGRNSFNMKLPLCFSKMLEGRNINHKTELIANGRECF